MRTSFISFMLMLCLLGWHTEDCHGILSAQSCQYIQGLIKQFQTTTGPRHVDVINPPINEVGKKGVDEICFGLPTVLLWNPYVAYPQFVTSEFMKCKSCGLAMHVAYWLDGSSATTQPRILHTIDRIVLLVSAVYACENNHRILAHDEAVLQCFPVQHVIPFILLHRTGFTRELVDTCTAFVRRGVNFYNMETLILERRWETFAKQVDTHLLYQDSNQQTSAHSDFSVSELAKSPSNNILAKCFLSGFLQDEHLYLREMMAIPIGDTISFDHTFKVATNIGYLREDNVWIPQYDSLFIVMNRNGKIVTWQLTKGTYFTQIEKLLTDLHHRAGTQKCQIRTVYIDDCCKLRNKIQRIFGKDISVKLDLFHAIQRITRTLPKRHNQAQQCLEDLRLVFRKDGDSGKKRFSHTPPPDIIMSKMEGFIDRWKDIQSSAGKCLFSSDTLHAIDNLKRHIKAGCLSGIPPDGGTNRNERFHSHIKSYFNRSRIGILLAYALLTVIMHSHNTAIKISGKTVVRPIAASPFRMSPPVSLCPIGISPKLRQKESLSDSWELDVNECEMDIYSICSIYKRSLYKLNIARSLASMKLTQLQSKIFTFKPFAVSTLPDSDMNHDLQRQLSDSGLKYCPVTADGNCFFKAIAVNLVSENERWAGRMAQIGVTVEIAADVELLSKHLRHVFVHELLGERRLMYESFMENGEIEFELEANKFLQQGYFDSCLGNTMPLALATALQANIIILSTNHHNPLYVTPDVVTSHGTLFVVYNPSGLGHYDAALPYHKPNVSPKHSVEKSVTCSCGVNSKGAGIKSCIPQPHYHTRCKCYRNKQSCTSLCRCKDCGNPHGNKGTKESVKRIRRPHSQQLQLPNSKRFALDRGESISTAIWSDFETIVITEIEQSDECVEDISDVTKLYNDVVYYSSSVFCSCPLPNTVVFRDKTLSQIESKLQYLHSRS